MTLKSHQQWSRFIFRPPPPLMVSGCLKNDGTGRITQINFNLINLFLTQEDYVICIYWKSELTQNQFVDILQPEGWIIQAHNHLLLQTV